MPNGLSKLVDTNITDDNENDAMYPRSVRTVPMEAPVVPLKQHGHSHDASQMNMRGVFLHVLSDALGMYILFLILLFLHILFCYFYLCTRIF